MSALIECPALFTRTSTRARLFLDGVHHRLDLVDLGQVRPEQEAVADLGQNLPGAFLASAVLDTDPETFFRQRAAAGRPDPGSAAGHDRYAFFIHLITS